MARKLNDRGEPTETTAAGSLLSILDWNEGDACNWTGLSIQDRAPQPTGNERPQARLSLPGDADSSERSKKWQT